MPSAESRRKERRLRRIEAALVAARLLVVVLLAWSAIAGQRAMAEVNAARSFPLQVMFATAVVGAVLVAIVAAYTTRVRRRDASAVAVSEASLRRLANDNPDGVVVLVGGRIVFVNEALATMLQYDRESLLGTHGVDLVHPDEREEVLRRIALVEREQTVTAPRVLRYLRRDGSSCEVEARGAALRYDGDDAVQVVVRDLTVRRKAEAALVAGERRFRAVLQAMDEGVVLQDRALAIELHNDAAERILGLSADQLAGRTSFHPDWQARDEHGAPLEPSQHMAAIALRTGAPASGVMCVQRPPMSQVWIHVNAVPLFRDGESEPYAVVATFTDITAQRKALEQLRESEFRYRLLAQHSADLVTRRSRENTIEYASPSHEAILGYRPDELVGRVPYEWVHPDDVQHVRALREQVPADGYPIINARLQHKDGHYVWLEIATTVLRTDDGEPDGFVVTARDVSSRQELEEKLRQSQKMEVMGRMASGVAHDFNNLLTVIRASAEMLRFEVEPTGTSLELVDDIASATDRAAALTAHLLTFSRRRHAAHVPVQPGRLLRDALPVLRRLAGDPVALHAHITVEAREAWMLGDPLRVEQVLLNLVSNARDAMPDGGDLRITVAMVTLAESITHRFGVIAAGDYVTLTVEDTGLGMSNEVLAHLFDPFYTTKPQGRGTGLGLSIVYGAVHEAHGTITVSSEPGHGSRLTVYWPRTDAPAAAPPGVPAAALAAPSASSEAAGDPQRASETGRSGAAVAPTILLVDDEDNVRRVIARQLQAGGYQVLTASSGAMALAILRDPTITVDALVSDVRMPGMSGVQLVTTMLAEGIEHPVLLVSGQLDQPLPSSWPGAGRVRFLPKPLTGETLRTVVGELLPAPAAG
ncbi:MAG: PAS domain S-box protein [Gemmatimonadota bacterium]